MLGELKSKKESRKSMFNLQPELVEYFETNRPKRFKRVGFFLQLILDKYLEDPSAFGLTTEHILKFEKMEKGKGNFSFYLPRVQREKLEELALINMRSLRQQEMHFLYSVYVYMNDKKPLIL